MEIKADEITAILKQQLADYEKTVDVAEVGTVLSVGDGIARVYGLDKAMAGELLEFRHDVFGLVLNLEEDNVGVVLLGESHEGQGGRRGHAHRPHHLRCRSGPALIGRVVNALGQPIDGKGPIKATESYADRAQGARHHRPQAGERAAADRHQGDRRDDPDRPRPARADHRRPPDRQDRHRDRHDHQPEGQGRRLHLRRHRPEAVDGRPGRRDARGARRDGVHDHRRRPPRRSRRRCSSSRPYAGCTMGEYFRDNGSTRSSSTTISRSRPSPTASSRCCCAARRAARRTPATSSISTRACSSAPPSSRDEHGGGSLTALPIIETQAGDVSAYIPTNVISITDGQIFLETDLFYSGVRPAVNVGISVSRVGGARRSRR